MVRKKLADASKMRRVSWYVGTVWGSGTSNVSMHDVNQTSSGNNSGQYLRVGNAGNDTSNVSIHDVNQTQSSNGSYQSLDIGSVN